MSVSADDILFLRFKYYQSNNIINEGSQNFFSKSAPCKTALTSSFAYFNTFIFNTTLCTLLGMYARFYHSVQFRMHCNLCRVKHNVYIAYIFYSEPDRCNRFTSRDFSTMIVRATAVLKCSGDLISSQF